MSNLSAIEFDFFREFVFKRTAIVLDAKKHYLVETRMQALIRKEGLESISQIVGRLRAANDPDLSEKVVNAMTTNETFFFRDPHFFDALKHHVLPEIAEKRPGMVKIWCAACSSGQEPYSLAMMIKEHLPALDKRYQILATDIDTEMLKTAQAGKYSQVEVNRGLPAALMAKYFDKRGIRWTVKPELQRSITFKRMNLVEPWGVLPEVDLILMRNVLIYFGASTKTSILGNVKRVLRPGGYLMLGATENTWTLDDAFKRKVVGQASAYQL